MNQKVLLITPPFTQLNTPYPATAYIKGFLNTKNVSSFQADLGIETILALFSKQGLTDLFAKIDASNVELTDNTRRIIALKKDYIQTIDAIVLFLQGKNPTLSHLICQEDFLPEASRFAQLDDLDWAFGSMGTQDKAKHLATLYLEDLSDFIKECVEENFGFCRYAERLGRSAISFDEMYAHLQNQLTYVDAISIKILEKKIQEVQPKLVLISVPFPGNLYSAFRCAQFIKKKFPKIKISMGGGFPNTELRDIKDKRVFDFFDFITLDDGELPVELLYKHVTSNTLEKVVEKQFKRTIFIFYRNRVCNITKKFFLRNSQCF